jgi:glycosyltransferase involved in cell wall biosynthesis
LFDSERRIIAYHQRENNSNYWIEYLPIALKARDSDWFCQLDADDVYAPDFFEKMYNFALENDLDLAACGYEKVDSETDRTLKTRVLNTHLILSGNDFIDRFITYRGFTVFLWAKLVSMPLFCHVLDGFVNPSNTSNDSIFMLNVFYESKRAGIYAESLIRYYQYGDSFLRRTDSKEIEFGLMLLWRATRDYLLRQGEISKLNEDFLYAIYLSQLHDIIDSIYIADVPLSEKLNRLIAVFNTADSRKMLTRDVNLQFNNLAERAVFVADIKDWVKKQCGYEAFPTKIAELTTLLDVVNK